MGGKKEIEERAGNVAQSREDSKYDGEEGLIENGRMKEQAQECERNEAT